MQSFVHETVLLNETVESVNPKDGGLYIDCTLGGAGHTERLLSLSGPTGRVLGLDQDETALAHARNRLAAYADRITLVHTNFRHVDEAARRVGFSPADGIVFDLGVSSPQFDVADRGFSYRFDAPLDMRMDRSHGKTAAEVVNAFDEQELARVFFQYGEEKFSRAIARNIVKARAVKPIETTNELAELIKESIPAKARRTGPHPARRVFQALRILVNDELGALEDSLEKAFQVLRPGGRMAIITFHSLEDRIVKTRFAEWCKGCTCPPGFPVCVCGKEPRAKLVHRKPLTASDVEIERNPRARSAHLRAIEKISDSSQRNE